MPFAKRCRMTLENISDEDMYLYYQINYSEAPVADNAAYFHAQFRRINPLPYKKSTPSSTALRATATYMAWGVNNSGWWGEGEIKFSWTATTSSRPSAAQERTTFADL